MRFGEDLDGSLSETLPLMAPNIIKTANEGRLKRTVSSLIDTPCGDLNRKGIIAY